MTLHMNQKRKMKDLTRVEGATPGCGCTNSAPLLPLPHLGGHVAAPAIDSAATTLLQAAASCCKVKATYGLEVSRRQVRGKKKGVTGGDALRRWLRDCHHCWTPCGCFCPPNQEIKEKNCRLASRNKWKRSNKILVAMEGCCEPTRGSSTGKQPLRACRRSAAA